MNRYTVIVILLLITTLIFLNHQFPYVLSDRQNYGYILQAILMLVVLTLGIARTNISLVTVMKWTSVWLGIVLALLTGYSYQYELKAYAGRIFGQLTPSIARTDSDGSMSFYSSANGHFMIDTTIQGQVVHFLLDTGASKVTLTQQDAKLIGINTDNLVYDVKLSTANGVSFAAPIIIDEIRIGELKASDVEAYVSSGGLDTSLLGMSFLNKLKRYEVSRNAIKMWGE